MQPLLKIKPRRLSYLAVLALLAALSGTVSSLLNIVLYKDLLLWFSASVGLMIGVFIAFSLVWVYDEINKFERLSVILTKSAIIAPEAWFRRKTILLSELDKQQTLVYNSEDRLHSRIRYTFWSTDGTSIAVSKFFYGKYQIDALIERIGLSKQRRK